jgi:streptogramin lyase
MTTGQIVTWSFDQFITGMCIENAGSIWLTGTFVGHFEPLSGVFEMYELKAPSVTCAFNPILTNGKIWTIAMEAIPLTGFSGNKLMSFDPFDPSFQAYYQLPADHNALGMTKDIEGDLWTISSNGFTRFNVVSGTCTLVESAYSCRKACSDGNGNIYFISDVFESIGSSIVRFSSKDQSFTEYWRSTYWTLFGMTIVDITVLRGEYQQR